ncbi:MAG: TonB-dependent receptor [Crocinitomicaceae bacterium]|nr:TonB-dependent receptor [Crocinitomicaceae bacterium]
MRRIFIHTLFLFYTALLPALLRGQDSSVFKIDTTSVQTLEEVTIESKKNNSFGITHLRQVEGTAIYAGKKSEVVLLSDTKGNLAANNAREVYGKVAGLNIWESDGAGIQLGIGGRGLNPNRVSNFNTRQNGYDISADALGYPESYYTPPAEALERIEVVRGAASLQYGTQFGGFINFKFKQPPKNKLVLAEVRQTIGSFGFTNTFVSLSGTKGKWRYYSFYQYKTGNGWRPNSGFGVHTAHTSVGYELTEKTDITIEYTFMNYLAQQPGGLTDNQFLSDARKSFRSRNWFSVNWNLFALNMDHTISETSRINLKVFGLRAQRDALGYMGMINRKDPMTDRNLLQDKFHNKGAEIRYLRRYMLLENSSIFLVGGRYYNGKTYRKQGNASDGSSADFTFLHPDDLEHSDYLFPSRNVSLFSENVFTITPKLTITPGLRLEYISTKSDGYYNEINTDLAGNIIYKNKVQDNRNNDRAFLLFGIGTGYTLKKGGSLYANFSQNYRSINFNDMRIVNPNSRVDNNLKDETGYSADLGIRGNMKNYLSYDFSLFYLKYNDRIGSVLMVDSFTYQPYRYRTNISDSRNIGMEAFAEADIYKMLAGASRKLGISVFGNFSLIDARYVNSKQSAFADKMVEFAPRMILRSGLSISCKSFRMAYQYSYTGDQFTDATNSKYSANAVTGLIPAYYIMDLSASYTVKKLIFSAGINNLSDNRYFTRRSDGYPGPGIIPSDGRSFYLTIGARF